MKTYTRPRTRIIDVLVNVMKDGKSHRLADLAHTVKEYGYKKNAPTKYIAVAKIIANQPKMFKKVSRGCYKLNKNGKELNLGCNGTSRVRELIADMLEQRNHMSHPEIWRALRNCGETLSVESTYSLLQHEMFKKDSLSRYSNDNDA